MLPRMPSLIPPRRSTRALPDPASAAAPCGPVVPVAIAALAVALAATLLLPGLPALRAARLAASVVLAAVLLRQRRGAGGAIQVLGWSLAVSITAFADTGAGAPANVSFVLGMLLGPFVRRRLARWAESLPAPALAALAVAGVLPLVAGQAAGWGVAARDTLLVRLDRAVTTLVDVWLLLAGFRATAELVRRWIRRVRVRTKLIVAFGIFAVTPALLVFLYVLLSGWMHWGAVRASAVARELEMASAGRGLVRAAARGPEPSGGSDLAAWLGRERPVLEAGGLQAVALAGGAGTWRVAGRLGGPDSLFLPAAAPVSDSARVVRGLALRAGRFWWIETALWAHGADSLALQTFEPVDTVRLNEISRLLRCDALLVGTRSLTASSHTTISFGGRRPGVRRGIGTEEGAIRIEEDQGAPGAPVDSAAVDTLLSHAHLTLVGGGRYAGLSSLARMSGPVSSGASPPCALWTGSHWREGAALVFVRSGVGEGLALSDLEIGPFSYALTFVLVTLVVLFLVIEIVSLVVGSRVAGHITRGAANLRAAAAAIGQGDFSVRVQVPSQDELGELAASFNRMAEGLAEGQRAVLERERMRRELELARRIQSRLLPPGPPVLPSLDVAATNTMSQEVGGDYYDFIPMADGRLGVCIADVAGKGVAAALLMSSVKAALVSSAAVETAPGRLVGRVNRLLEQSIEPGRFVTLFFASLDPSTLRLDYVNAGHPAPVLLRGDGSIERLERGGTILGIDAGTAYEEGSVGLSAGDLLALFTDGVTEARGADEELFGDERIESLLRADRGRPAADTLEHLLAEVSAYEGARGPSDDLTAIIVCVRVGDG